MGRSWLVSLMSVLAFSACGGEDRPGSALLVTLDTTNPEGLSMYGASDAITPNLASLASDGIVFESARSPMPMTLPSHASMLTGLYPLRHGLRVNGREALASAAETVAERARERGYRTGAVVAAVVLNGEFGLAQGFEVYDQPEGRKGSRTDGGMVQRTAEDVADRALAWLGELGDDEPFFLWVHFFDPHHPLEPPPEFLQQAGDDPYLGELAYVDHQFGRIWEELRARGRDEDCTVIVVGDHGEGQWRHGEETHGALTFDSTLRVPLVVRPAGGLRFADRNLTPVSLVDVHPTLLACMDLGNPGQVDGLDLLAEGLASRGGVYFESYMGSISFGWGHLAGWVDSSGKYIHSSEPEYYDVVADRQETENLVVHRVEAVERAKARIAALDALPKLEPELPQRDAELLGDIQDLGYAGVGGSVSKYPRPLEAGGGPNPKNRMQAYAKYFRAKGMVDTERRGEAVAMLQDILRENPANHSAWLALGNALIQEGRHAQALSALQRSEGLSGGGVPELHVNLAVAHHHTGQIDEAIEHYMHAVDLDPGLDEFRATLVQLLERAGRLEEAGQYRE